jgi:hypothetical protein
MWIVFQLHGYGPMTGSSDHGTELSRPMKGGENLDQLRAELISEEEPLNNSC